MKKLQKKTFVFLFIYLCLFLSLGSTWVNKVAHFSQLESRIFTIMVYLPFVLAVFYKLLIDIKNAKNTISSPGNCIYYALALYYVLLTAYRFVHGMEIKENLYYSIIFFGAIAIYMLLRDRTIPVSKQDLAQNLVLIAVVFVLYRLGYSLIGVHFFENPPINLNLTAGAVAILLPFVGNMLANDCSEKKVVLPWIVFCSSIIVIASTGARAIFILSVVNVAVLVVANLGNRTGVIRVASAVLVGCVLVVMLALADVGDVRYSIYRETGIKLNAINIWERPEESTGTENNTTDDATTQVPSEPTDHTQNVPTQLPDDNQSAAHAQIEASDRMRKDLVQYGLEQVKANPWFGSGDVEYWYQISEEYGFMQSSHNFLIEAIICYGCVGLLIIAALFIAILVEAKLFSKTTPCCWNIKITLMQTILFYFALGFVQPTVFDSIICLLFILTVATCRKALHETN